MYIHLECHYTCYICSNFNNIPCKKCKANTGYPYYTAALKTCNINCSSGYYID